MPRRCAHRLQDPTQVANTADAPLRYTARSEGNCTGFAFPRQPRTTQAAPVTAAAATAPSPTRCLAPSDALL